MSVYILVVDDEPDVEALFRQQFRRDLRGGRFVMEFTLSAPAALQRVMELCDCTLVLIFSDINMPGMTGLDMLPRMRAARPDVPIIMITAYGDPETRKAAIERGAEGLHQANRFRGVASGDRFEAWAGCIGRLFLDDEGERATVNLPSADPG